MVSKNHHEEITNVKIKKKDAISQNTKLCNNINITNSTLCTLPNFTMRDQMDPFKSGSGKYSRINMFKWIKLSTNHANAETLAEELAKFTKMVSTEKGW